MESSDVPEQISHEAEKFYDEIRGLVVVFLFFTFFFTLSHLTIQYFLTKTDWETKLSRSDRLVYQLVLGICTFTLTIGFTSCSILPFSIGANEILFIFPQSYYVQWLNSELVQDLTLVVNLGMKISCLIIPFSYFLLISQGFQSKSNSLTPRLLEAFCNLLFFYILIFGTVWSFSSFIHVVNNLLFNSTNKTNSNDFLTIHPLTFLQNTLNKLCWFEFIYQMCLSTLINALEIMQLVVSFVGLLLLLICVPLGLLGISLNLITQGIRSLRDLKTNTKLQDEIEQLNFEAINIMDDIQTVYILRGMNSVHNHSTVCLQTFHNHHSNITGYSVDDFLTQRTNELEVLRIEILQVRHKIRCPISVLMREWLKPITYISCFGFFLFLLPIMESFVLFNILRILWNLIFGDYIRKSDADIQISVNQGSIISDSLDSKFALGLKPVSSLGHIGAIFQISMIHLLLLISLWGFYSLPYFRFLRPRCHSTSLDVILVNIVLVLMLTAALPLQTNLLGLTTFTLPNPLKSHSTSSSSSFSSHIECSQVSCNSVTNEFRSNPKINWNKCKHLIKCASVIDAAADDDDDDNVKISWFKSWIQSFYSISSLLVFLFPSKTDSLAQTIISSESPISNIHEKFESHEQSIFAQFLSRALGYPTVSTNNSLRLIILLYNLGFLVTSVWIAGRRLRDATLTFGLEIVTTFRCLNQMHWTSRQAPSVKDVEHSIWMNELPCTNNLEESNQAISI